MFGSLLASAEIWGIRGSSRGSSGACTALGSVDENFLRSTGSTGLHHRVSFWGFLDGFRIGLTVRVLAKPSFKGRNSWYECPPVGSYILLSLGKDAANLTLEFTFGSSKKACTFLAVLPANRIISHKVLIPTAQAYMDVSENGGP